MNWEEEELGALWDLKVRKGRAGSSRALPPPPVSGMPSLSMWKPVCPMGIQQLRPVARVTCPRVGLSLSLGGLSNELRLTLPPSSPVPSG